ncbi:MAG: ABC transporter permease [Candidatus Aminicenantes bacterium]|nr:ABC transporter permease [Candidatus Aminicenantes bacterium]MDH5743665.1 ABC transporter permease [Candidatus Aminicenantes bacterium]
MFKNYLKIAWRNIKRQKVYSAINVIGLAIGLSSSLILFFFVRDDLTYDRFHEHINSIYRVVGHTMDAQRWAIIPGPLIPVSIEEIPEVIAGARTYVFGRLPIQRADQAQEENSEQNAARALTLATDPGFFDVFSFKILKGDVSSMETPNGVFLTPDIASTLFGEEDPIGQPLLFRPVENAYVAGIVEAPPRNSHIQYEIIVRLRVEQNPAWWDSWINSMLTGYIRLNAEAEASAAEEKITRIAHANGHTDYANLKLQSLKDIHLHSAVYQYDRNFGKSDMSVVYLLSAAGLIILLIASINFINLSSARAATRAREVGMRKVIGSQRWQLITQFLGESIFITLIAMCIACVILQLALPHFAGLLGKTLEINILNNPLLLLALLATAVFIGILSGLYPALILSAFRPIRILRGEFQTGRAGILMRRVFIVFQFAITIALFVGVSTVLVQIKYVRSFSFGYNREHVLVIPDYVGNRDDLLKMKVLDMSSVLSAGRSNYLISENFRLLEAFPHGKDRETSKFFPIDFWIDEGFFDTLDIPIVQGRNFSRERLLDREDAVIVNEAASKKTDLDDPIEKELNIITPQGNFVTKKVIGVVRDFHFQSARRSLKPIIFRFDPERSYLLLIRIAPGQIAQTISRIESTYREIYPDRDFRYSFMDEVFNEQFIQDREFAFRLGAFSGVAIFIACLGLIGMVAFSVEERRKEIAIRKVLGSSEARIIKLLGSDFLKWVAVANVIAWPLGYFGMNRWLSVFAYRVPFTIWPFVIAGICALAIALLTMFYQSLKAARTNPAAVLRHDK